VKEEIRAIGQPEFTLVSFLAYSSTLKMEAKFLRYVGLVSTG
jgi:hypothetical protein